MDYRLKVMLFREGRYRIRLQPMSTTGWTLRDWVGFVDRFGHWTRPMDDGNGSGI